MLGSTKVLGSVWRTYGPVSAVLFAASFVVLFGGLAALIIYGFYHVASGSHFDQVNIALLIAIGVAVWFCWMALFMGSVFFRSAKRKRQEVVIRTLNGGRLPAPSAFSVRRSDRQ